MAHLTNKESPLRLSKRKQAERGLSPTNAIAKQTSLEFQHLAAIVAGSDDAIISKTLDGIVTSWNASAARMFGHTAREMVGQPIACIVPVDLQDEEREIVAKVARGEPIDHYETIRIAKDGRPVPVSLTVSPLYDAAGKVVGASKNARDMTARKQAADALRDADEAAQLTHIDNKSLMVSERFIKKVMDATPGLMAYWTSDLRCKLANKPYFEWFGRTADGIIGISVLELFGEKLFAINEPHIRGVLAGEKQQFEREMTSADGKLRQTLVNFIPDVVGDEVLGYFAQSTDVTAMKATEAALRDEIAGRERANQLLWESEMALQQAQRLGQFGSWEWQVEEDIMSWSDEL
jgi:PAS domain S-box-containing protein